MFWFMNHILNPIMMVILRSPFHGWMSKSLLMLTVRGKKSGKQYSLVTNYFQDGKTVTIIPAMAEKKTWWRNLRGGGTVRLVLRGVEMQGQAELIEGSAGHPDALGMLTTFLRANPSMAGMLGLEGDGAGGFSAESLKTASEKLIAVRISL
jgi:hypothetical protein